MANEQKNASFDAKLFAVGQNGKPLEGDPLRVFTEKLNQLQALLGSSRTSCWRIGGLLHEIRPEIRKSSYRGLSAALRISRRTAERYLLVRTPGLPKVRSLCFLLWIFTQRPGRSCPEDRAPGRSEGPNAADRPGHHGGWRRRAQARRARPTAQA